MLALGWSGEAAFKWRGEAAFTGEGRILCNWLEWRGCIQWRGEAAFTEEGRLIHWGGEAAFTPRLVHPCTSSGQQSKHPFLSRGPQSVDPPCLVTGRTPSGQFICPVNSSAPSGHPVMRYAPSAHPHWRRGEARLGEAWREVREGAEGADPWRG